jgi:hypothetical protein
MSREKRFIFLYYSFVEVKNTINSKILESLGLSNVQAESLFTRLQRLG